MLATLFIQHRLSATGEVADEAHEKLFIWRNALLGGAGAFLLLFGFAGLYVVVKDRGAAFAPAEAVAGEALPGIAIQWRARPSLITAPVTGETHGEVCSRLVALAAHDLGQEIFSPQG